MEKEEFNSIFFFSHNVFKRIFPPGHQKSSLCGKGLKAENKYDGAEIVGVIFKRKENIVGKGANAGYQHFFFS